MAEPSNTSGEASDQARKPNNKAPVCRFYNTKAGCKAGQSCRFRHVQQTEQTKVPPLDNRTAPEVPSSSSPDHKTARDVASTVASRVVARPTPQAQRDDPRAFQIGQIQRRFKAESSQHDGGTTLTFRLTPTDPDFPYEIEKLECELSVPTTYPSAAKPTLRVRNKDIPRGFQINIERGFDALAAENRNSTLLALMNRLDLRLEAILSGKGADTVKIISNQGTASTAPSQPPKVPNPDVTKETPAAAAPTLQQVEEAARKRQSDVRQLEARFNKLPSFSKSSDGMLYTVPLDSPKRSAWPATLQSLKVACVAVPQQYPLEPLTLHLDNDSAEAKAVEAAFVQRSRQQPDSTITQQINYLSQHVKDMAVFTTMSDPEGSEHLAEPQKTVVDEEQPSVEERADSHIQYIPRPPEWDIGNDSEDSVGDDSSEFDTYDEDDTAGDEEETAAPTAAPAERGILLSFPRLELHGIELLELTSLNITVKCERCKDTMDIERLRSATESSKMREESCKKCAAGLAVRFRADMIHANSVRGGYLDLDGCTVVDMLPSNFIPTCSECSTAYPAPGVVAVRGDAALAICREDHRKMTFRIIEVKFLQISASAVRASRAPGKKKVKESLGITVGTELPRQGRCTHYRKSYRWFRFSCCQRVFACDRCHDEQTDHPTEHANRMLCGFCSREQNYRPDDCGICHAALTGKKGSGFWEGGKGTRDPMRMSRKDPRKYKRRPGTKPKT